VNGNRNSLVLDTAFLELKTVQALKIADLNSEEAPTHVPEEGMRVAHRSDIQATSTMLESPASRSDSGHLTLTRWLIAIAIAACLFLLRNINIPLWFQPTAVGLLWAGLYLAGFMLGGIRSGVFSAACVAFACSWLFGYCFLRITDLAASDCLLVSALLLSCGWLTARLDRLTVASQLSARFGESRYGLRQWSIADIVFVTTMVACFCKSLPQLAAPPMLLLSVLLALAAGLACSWIAYRWAWSDEWSARRCLLVAAMLGLITVYLFSYAPTGMTFLEAATWMLTGPANVIAAQGVAVLFTLAIVRFELSARKLAPPSTMSAF
jgi:hypothetical protein